MAYYDGNIQVTLLTDCHLGKRGDSIKVKLGYFRNFLLPNGLAAVENSFNNFDIAKYDVYYGDFGRKRATRGQRAFSRKQDRRLKRVDKFLKLHSDEYKRVIHDRRRASRFEWLKEIKERKPM